MSHESIDAIVLAGGKGTRLQSVVSDRPKPLAEVAGRPFVEWLLLSLRTQGVRRVVLATGHKGDMIEDRFADGARLGLELRYAREQTPLGTGGAARHALPYTTTDRVLVLNGDSFCPFEMEQLLELHRGKDAQATLWAVEVDDCRRYGTVAVAPDGRVLAFHEKSPEPRAGLINAGIYLFNARTLADLPPGQPASLEQDVLPALIGRGLYATVGAGPFLDIGTPESYALADEFLARNRALWNVDV